MGCYKSGWLGILGWSVWVKVRGRVSQWALGEPCFLVCVEVSIGEGSEGKLFGFPFVLSDHHNFLHLYSFLHSHHLREVLGCIGLGPCVGLWLRVWVRVVVEGYGKQNPSNSFLHHSDKKVEGLYSIVNYTEV